MLDTTLFNVEISLPAQVNKKSGLVLSGCRVVMQDNNVYSEFDDLNFYPLNNNDYGCGKTNIELNFENTFQNPYFKFFIQCISIRTNNKTLCKINRNPLPKGLLLPNHSKVTKEGKVALGFSYYFRNSEEKNSLVNCKSFCIEGFTALDKKMNVYGFMCRINKVEDKWEFAEGNTYRIYNHTRITGLYH